MFRYDPLSFPIPRSELVSVTARAVESTVVTGQGGESKGSAPSRSKDPAAIRADLLRGMKDATDKSAGAMHKDKDGYPYSLGNGTLGQGRQPARGTPHVMQGHELFTEDAPYFGDLLSVGHVHKPGTSKGFSDWDKTVGERSAGHPVPIMKNRDGYINSRTGQVEQYDLYYRGWRWYLRPDMSILGGPTRY